MTKAIEEVYSSLKGQFRGDLIRPGDDDYETARGIWNGMVARRPGLIARCADVPDIQSAVSAASTIGVVTAVRCGGHSLAGFGSCADGLVIELSRMRQVTVDCDARRARLAGGCLLGSVDVATQKYGLVFPAGVVSHTGASGLILGGGFGWLTRRFGLSCDHVEGLTLVTADGSVVHASSRENADLFWALRGGGGNFGVVTEFTFRLHPVGLLLGGKLDYRLEEAPVVLSVWRDVIANAPDSLESFAQVYRDPVVGEGLVNASIAWLGAVDAGLEAIRELTHGLSPVRNTVRPMYYSEVQDLYERMPFGLRNYWSGRFLGSLPDELLELTSEQFLERELAGGVLIEPLHGAASRVASAATAFAGREARWNATFINVWTDPDEDELQIETARAYSRSLEPWKIGGGYLNYAAETMGDNLETEFGA